MPVSPCNAPIIETVRHDGQEIACIIRSGQAPTKTQFLTPEHWSQQVGFIVYPAGSEIARHRHRPLERRIVGTSEVLVVRQGRCEVDLYSEDGAFICTHTLSQGDVIVIVAGGHRYRMLEDTVLFEVKQGPYTGLDEKEYF